jgi:hypothetical protein
MIISAAADSAQSSATALARMVPRMAQKMARMQISLQMPRLLLLLRLLQEAEAVLPALSQPRVEEARHLPMPMSKVFYSVDPVDPFVVSRIS